MNGVALFKRYSMAELIAMKEDIQRKPENQMKPGSLYLYTPKARKWLDEIGWAIYYHLTNRSKKA